MESVSVLFVGDIIGKPGLSFVQLWLPALKKEYKPDIVIANGENVNDGKGIIKSEGEALFQIGVDVITGGNHIWDKHQSQDYLKNEPRVLRPLNYPKGTHGNGMYLLQRESVKLGVVNLQGRSFMATIDCPFRGAEFAISKLKSETNLILIDFHAEATAEKIALGWYLDGKVSAIIGTHTHIQTADERILPNGTGYITDVGMTGPYESVIGMKSQAAINRFIYQTPQKYETAQNDVHLSAVLMTLEIETGKCTSIKRIFFPEFA